MNAFTASDFTMCARAPHPTSRRLRSGLALLVKRALLFIVLFSVCVCDLQSADPQEALYLWLDRRYPFSTQNEADYRNLLSVYLDATFFPVLREADFRQVRWGQPREAFGPGGGGGATHLPRQPLQH